MNESREQFISNQDGATSNGAWAEQSVVGGVSRVAPVEGASCRSQGVAAGRRRRPRHHLPPGRIFFSGFIVGISGFLGISIGFLSDFRI